MGLVGVKGMMTMAACGHTELEILNELSGDVNVHSWVLACKSERADG